MRSRRICGIIQTTFQIQYKGNYIPNSCIQCNLLLTFPLQLEFISGLGSGSKSEGLRIWLGQDLCKELAVRKVTVRRRAGFLQTLHHFYLERFRRVLCCRWRSGVFLKLEVVMLANGNVYAPPLSGRSSNLQSHPFISLVLRSEWLRWRGGKDAPESISQDKVSKCVLCGGENHLDSEHRAPLKCLEPSTASTEPIVSLPAKKERKIRPDLPTKS